MQQNLPTHGQLCVLAKETFATDIDSFEWSARIKDLLVKRRFDLPMPHRLTDAMNAVQQALAKRGLKLADATPPAACCISTASAPPPPQEERFPIPKLLAEVVRRADTGSHASLRTFSHLLANSGAKKRAEVRQRIASLKEMVRVADATDRDELDLIEADLAEKDARQWAEIWAPTRKA